ncbi:MAG TPA: ATP-binding protein [Candidatus Woesearchaeota archaeon]|nr:ATP-binding protein [Candidatus Woesearchaeota archaeon]
MKERLEELNPWWNRAFEYKAIQRPKYLNSLKKQLLRKDVAIITGIRRVGKTTLLKQLIAYLLNKGINPKHILFVSLDLLFFKPFTIQDIVLEYKKIHKIPHSQKVFLFLDEITYKDNFSQELKNLYDLGNYAVFASSSSAKVLKDKKAFLTGRARYFEVKPLDFEEFALFKGKDVSKTDLPILKSLFEEYMKQGGLPEYVLSQDPAYLSELLELIISKDVISEHNIKNRQQVYDLFRLLCERVGKQVSYNRLSKILGIDNETVSRYISYFLDTFLFSMIEVKGKLNERIKSKKKLYCVDVGLRNVVTGFRDIGAIYENLVYNSIKGKKPFFLLKNGVEIDFCFGNTLIEAKYGQDLTPEQKKLFYSSEFKQKIVAKGVGFFLDNSSFSE